ncbi:MAG: NTP transferase domain-containing protein [Candidatus Korobacteraceae bacterium]
MEARHHRIGAIVLAAGMSSRMGEPKQLLRLGERTVLQQTLENLRGSRVDEIILVLGFAAEKIAAHLAAEGVKVVINPQFGEGMGSSLRTGLAALDPQVSAALVVLADQPFVRPATLNQLIEGYIESGAQIAIPTYRGFRGNPVLLDRSVFAEVMALTGDVGCRAIFGSHTEGIVKVPADDVGVLLDIDDKDDFERLQRFASGEAIPATAIEAADLAGREIPQSTPSTQKDDLILVGADALISALAAFGKLLNFRVIIVDPLLKIANAPDADRVLNTLDFSQLPSSNSRHVIVASRGRFDEEAVEQALRANAAYLGLVANKRRAQEVLRALEAKGAAPDALKAIRAPAGLNINAESPQEIALSIMAEIVREKKKRRGES